MTDWKKVKCNKCPELKKCKKTNTAKGSATCQRLLKLIPPKVEEKTMSKGAAANAMLWSMMQEHQKVKKGEEKE